MVYPGQTPARRCAGSAAGTETLEPPPVPEEPVQAPAVSVSMPASTVRARLPVMGLLARDEDVDTPAGILRQRYSAEAQRELVGAVDTGRRPPGDRAGD